MEIAYKGRKDPWVDIVKWAACMLVLLGHFFQSMIKSGIMSQTVISAWFEHTIYLFHVPLFFLCSGYLYQRNSKVNTLCEWKDSVIRKAVKLGVPYVTFSTVTYLMKQVFQDSVNTANGNSLLRTLFLNPISPYWYLYILFFIFLLTPTFKSKKQAWIALGISILIFTLQRNEIILQIFFLQGVMRWCIWFVLGTLLSFYRDRIKFDTRWLLVSLILFPATIRGFRQEFGMEQVWLLYSLIVGSLGCLLVLESAFWLNNKVSKRMIQFSRKNTLPVFLMHTIFAAGIRSVLLKFGITDLLIHSILGIGGCIVLPVVAAEIMRRSKWMYFFISPDIKRREQQR